MQVIAFARKQLTDASVFVRTILFAALPLAGLLAFATARADEPAATERIANKPTTIEATASNRPHIRLIGATTVVTEVSTGIPLAARVDTGATSCSIHCLAMEIKGEEKDPRENIGKPVRFLVKKSNGEDLWVESKIVDHVKVRTSEREDERYKVRLRLRWENVEKKVVATLNDRQNMKYPMLLGRNFLRDDFLVNVSMDANE